MFVLFPHHHKSLFHKHGCGIIPFSNHIIMPMKGFGVRHSYHSPSSPVSMVKPTMKRIKPLKFSLT